MNNAIYTNRIFFNGSPLGTYVESSLGFRDISPH